MTENYQVIPNRDRICLNDKATKILFNLTQEKYSALLNGKTRNVIEKNNYKKQGTIKSGYRLENAEGYTNIAPLDEYARAILDVAISEYDNGNRIISLAMIQRGLSGKVAKNLEINVNKNQLSDIKAAVDMLMCTQYDPDILQAYENLDYDGAETITKAAILPCKRTRKKINGQLTDLIYITDESPLYKQAKIKGQLLTYPADLLDVPNQNNTRLVVMLKNYTLRRVAECKQHAKNLKPILTIDDIFTKCRIKDAGAKAKFDARTTIEKLFAHLQAKGYIKSYEWTKKGNAFYSIKFTF